MIELIGEDLNDLLDVINYVKNTRKYPLQIKKQFTGLKNSTNMHVVEIENVFKNPQLYVRELNDLIYEKGFRSKFYIT